MTGLARIAAAVSLPLLVAVAVGCPGPGDAGPVAEVAIPEGLAAAPGFGHGGPAAPAPASAAAPTARPEPTPADAAPIDIPFDAALAKKGERQWGVNQCATCHTVERLAPGPSMQGGPDLSSVAIKYTLLKGGPDKARAWFAKHLADPRRNPGTLVGRFGVLAMPGFAHLGQAQMDELVELLMSFQKTPKKQ